MCVRDSETGSHRNVAVLSYNNAQERYHFYFNKNAAQHKWAIPKSERAHALSQCVIRTIAPLTHVRRCREMRVIFSLDRALRCERSGVRLLCFRVCPCGYVSISLHFPIVYLVCAFARVCVYSHRVWVCVCVSEGHISVVCCAHKHTQGRSRAGAGVSSVAPRPQNSVANCLTCVCSHAKNNVPGGMTD